MKSQTVCARRNIHCIVADVLRISLELKSSLGRVSIPHSPYHSINDFINVEDCSDCARFSRSCLESLGCCNPYRPNRTMLNPIRWRTFDVSARHRIVRAVIPPRRAMLGKQEIEGLAAGPSIYIMICRSAGSEDCHSIHYPDSQVTYWVSCYTT